MENLKPLTLSPAQACPRVRAESLNPKLEEKVRERERSRSWNTQRLVEGLGFRV